MSAENLYFTVNKACLELARQKLISPRNGWKKTKWEASFTMRTMFCSHLANSYMLNDFMNCAFPGGREERDRWNSSVPVAKWLQGFMISHTHVQAKCKQEHWSCVLTPLWRLLHLFPAESDTAENMSWVINCWESQTSLEHSRSNLET